MKLNGDSCGRFFSQSAWGSFFLGHDAFGVVQWALIKVGWIHSVSSSLLNVSWWLCVLPFEADSSWHTPRGFQRNLPMEIENFKRQNEKKTITTQIVDRFEQFSFVQPRLRRARWSTHTISVSMGKLCYCSEAFFSSIHRYAMYYVYSVCALGSGHK